MGRNKNVPLKTKRRQVSLKLSISGDATIAGPRDGTSKVYQRVHASNIMVLFLKDHNFKSAPDSFGANLRKFFFIQILT